MGHLGTHIGAVISLGAGAVSFTHIVKASEPVVSAALTAVCLGTYYSLPTYLSLLPIVGGVALASLKELSFTWLGFAAAMLSNVSSAARAILAKIKMQTPQGENMNETNLYAVLTIMSFCVLLPVSLLIEARRRRGVASRLVPCFCCCFVGVCGRSVRDEIRSLLFFARTGVSAPV